MCHRREKCQNRHTHVHSTHSPSIQQPEQYWQSVSVRWRYLFIARNLWLVWTNESSVGKHLNQNKKGLFTAHNMLNQRNYWKIVVLCERIRVFIWVHQTMSYNRCFPTYDLLFRFVYSRPYDVLFVYTMEMRLYLFVSFDFQIQPAHQSRQT